MLAGRETEESINEWQVRTFGANDSDVSIVKRANLEMIELLEKVEAGAPMFDVCEEAADIILVLNRLFMRNGVSMSAFVDFKMKLCRGRVWEKDAAGHNHHVSDPTEAAFRAREASLYDPRPLTSPRARLLPASAATAGGDQFGGFK